VEIARWKVRKLFCPTTRKAEVTRRCRLLPMTRAKTCSHARSVAKLAAWVNVQQDRRSVPGRVVELPRAEAVALLLGCLILRRSAL
jgi:hypothetical protein